MAYLCYNYISKQKYRNIGRLHENGYWTNEQVIKTASLKRDICESIQIPIYLASKEARSSLRERRLLLAPKFYMMVGLPGSGKSTVAAKLAAKTGAIIVSSDAIRGELYGDETIQGSHAYVFQLMEERTMAALAAGRSVIYDATNVTVERRRDFLAKLPRNVQKACIWVNVSKERALQNNLKRERHVPEWVIHQMADQLTPPTRGEGWDAVRIVTY